MRRNQRKGKIVKPLERILEVIGTIRAELSKQGRSSLEGTKRNTHQEEKPAEEQLMEDYCV